MSTAPTPEPLASDEFALPPGFKGGKIHVSNGVWIPVSEYPAYKRAQAAREKLIPRGKGGRVLTEDGWIPTHKHDEYTRQKEAECSRGNRASRDSVELQSNRPLYTPYTDSRNVVRIGNREYDLRWGE